MTALLTDLRYALRALRKTPAFTIIALLMLALGIGANTAIFSVLSAVLLEPLPFYDPDRLVMVWETDAANGTTHEGASVPDYVDFRARNHVFVEMAGISAIQVNLTRQDGEPERASAASVSSELFGLLGVEPILGRAFRPDEARAGGSGVVILSESFWRRVYGGNPAAIGRLLTLEGRDYTIVGVMPARFAVPFEDTRLWIPAQVSPTTSSRGRHGLVVMARLTATLAIMTGLLFTVFPAVQALRQDLQGSLNEIGRVSAAVGRQRVRHALVVAELALSVALAIGATLLLRSYVRLQQVDPGFTPDHVLKVELQLPGSRYPQRFADFPKWPEVSQFYDWLLERLHGLPGVTAVALAANHPLEAGFTTRVLVQGRAPHTSGAPEEIRVRPISPDYLKAIGLKLVRGRGFTDADRARRAMRVDPAVALRN